MYRVTPAARAKATLHLSEQSFTWGGFMFYGARLTTTLPSNTTFVGFSNTNGSCSHPAIGSDGAFTCARSSLLLAGHSWGPVTLTVKVNAASGSTVTETAHVTAKTMRRGFIGCLLFLIFHS